MGAGGERVNVIINSSISSECDVEELELWFRLNAGTVHIVRIH